MIPKDRDKGVNYFTDPQCITLHPSCVITAALWRSECTLTIMCDARLNMIGNSRV